MPPWLELNGHIKPMQGVIVIVGAPTADSRMFKGATPLMQKGKRKDTFLHQA